ncbi:hypothetical protein [Haloarchaeobius sp. DFWS5]|uniref:hypothetical protein n=1 Tax=Haloarchaeobius sp. DFWS5 TaxID=3446114 RepID=UPI003EBF6858
MPAILGTGPTPPEVGFVIVSAVALAMLAIGRSLRTEGTSTDSTTTAGESTIH